MIQNSDLITTDSKDTISLGRTVAGQLEGGEVICLYGELGSGKTTFMNGFIGHFLKNTRVLSPTFIIVRHYQPNADRVKEIYHADLYRILNPYEVEGLGLTGFMNKPGIVVAVEWAERLEKFLPEKRIDIRFSEEKNGSRRIIIKNNYEK